MAWSAAGTGNLDERRYYCQNWRGDVVALTKSTGVPLEYVRYSSYGEPTVYPVADLNMDGAVTSTDQTIWNQLAAGTASASAYTRDIDFDGAYASGGGDAALFSESYSANSGKSGKGKVSTDAVANRVGYAAYQWDPTIAAFHVRYRVYKPEIGRWTRRDPLGYFDSTDLFEYAQSRPYSVVDTLGLAGSSGLGGCAAKRAKLRLPMYPNQSEPPFSIQTPINFVVICCRPIKNVPGVFTHCELSSTGSCNSLGNQGWDPPVPAISTDEGKMDNDLPCGCATKQDVINCLIRNPLDARDDIPGIQSGGVPCSDKNPSIPCFNCQTNTRGRLSKCCQKTSWSPDFIADPVTPLYPFTKPITDPLLPYIPMLPYLTGPIRLF